LAEGERIAFRLKVDEIREVRIVRANEEIELKKENGEWRVTKPIAGQGEGPIIDGFLYSLVSQRLTPFAAPESKPHWAEYGLDPAPVTIIVKSAAREERVAVSDKAAFDGSFYVRQGDEILLGDAGMAQLKDRPLSSFRSRRLWREGDAQIARIDVTAAGDSYSLTPKGKQDWTLTPKPDFPVDPERIERWIAALKELAPADVASEDSSPEVQKQFLLTKPTLEVRMELAGEPKREWRLKIGQDRGEDVFLTTSRAPTVYQTPASAVADIRVPRAFFRESKSAFQFPLEAARRIDIHAGPFNQSFKKGESDWELVDAKDGRELNPETLVQFFQNLSALEAEEFPKVAKGALPKPPQIVIRDDKGAELLTLAWGDEYKPEQPFAADMKLRLVRSNRSRDPLGVDKTKLDRLLDPLMVQPKNKNPETK
ncbi:MAG TPA: DUF4340 domain-containing protein, partial [Bdellovibrionales bacterium]|nr:DUF4340 domain-containing protein [Bdellovibrionales bacterium]